jgi:branched-chain amino acid transport system substrate-binding protein
LVIMKKPLILAAALALTLGTVRGAESQPTKTPYRIGAILTLTGPAAKFGQHERDTATLAIEQINKAGGVNGHPLELVVQDDGQDPNNAVSAFNRLSSQDDIIAIFGATFGSSTLAFSSIDKRLGIPVLAPNTTYQITRVGNPNIFRATVGADLEVVELKAAFDKFHYKRAGLLYSTDAYGTQGADLIKHSGINVVETESFTPSATDLTTQLTKIRAANPDVLIIWDGVPGTGIGIKNAGQLGIKVPIYSGVTSNGPGNVDAAGNSPALPTWRCEGILDPDHPLPRQKAGFEAIKAAYHYDADIFAALGYDAMYVLADALKRAGDKPSRESLRDALEKTNNYQGVGAVLTYTKTNHEGAAPGSIVWLKVENGKFAGTKL